MGIRTWSPAVIKYHQGERTGLLKMVATNVGPNHFVRLHVFEACNRRTCDWEYLCDRSFGHNFLACGEVDQIDVVKHAQPLLNTSQKVSRIFDSTYFVTQ